MRGGNKQEQSAWVVVAMLAGIVSGVLGGMAVAMGLNRRLADFLGNSMLTD
jgi:heme A synthase